MITLLVALSLVVIVFKIQTVGQRQRIAQLESRVWRLESRVVQEPPVRSVDPLGRLGKDGSVRLPQAVIDRVGLRPGDFVYFIDDRIVTGEQMDATLPEPGTR